jgi:hypothetical protein
MELKPVIGFLLSATMLFVALKYGIVGGGGGVTSRKDKPILYWFGVAVVALMTGGALVIIVSMILARHP